MSEEAEAILCNAVLIKNVWEIRFREQIQKQQNEASRLEKSALQRINEDWQNRMGDKHKTHKRQEKKPPSGLPEGAPPKVRISVSKTRSPEFGSRPSGPQAAAARRPVDKKAPGKGDKLSLLSLLKISQPSGSAWTSSWKFSKPPGEGTTRPDGSEWGKSWKCINFQPQLDGKAWIDQEYANAESASNVEPVEVKMWEKRDRPVSTLETLESQLSSVWETSWKYKKSERKERDGAANERGLLGRLMSLDASHHCNEEKCSSEWNQSWKSTKPSENGDVCFEGELKQHEENNQQENEENSDSKWGTSWKYFNRRFHSDSVSGSSTKTSKGSKWAEAWKVSKPVEYCDESSEGTGEMMDYEPLDPHIHGVIMPVSRAEKYKFWNARFREGNTPIADWGKSWEAAKNMSILARVKPRKKVEQKAEKKKDEETREEESEPHGVLKPRDKLDMREKRMIGFSEYDFPYEWNAAWKQPRSQPKKYDWAKQSNTAIEDEQMIHQPHLKKRCLADWKESWKCSRLRTCFGRPSSTEWKESSFLGYELRKGREEWMRKVGIDKYQNKSETYETFFLPKRGMRAEMLNSIDTKHKYTFSSEWKDSCRSLKHQIRTQLDRDRPNRSRPFRDPEKGETPVSDWANAWKFTNATLAQDSGLWDQSWSSIQNVRQDRWERERERVTGEAPTNGPTGFRGWRESWMSTRRQHRVEGATAAQRLAQPQPQHQQQQQSRRHPPPAAGWEDSWRVSSTQFRQTLHDRPSATQWWDSWEFSGFNWYERPPREAWLEESMEIMPRKTLLREPRMGQFSTSFNPDVFQQRVPPTEWKDCWRLATLQKHHNRFAFKNKSYLFAPLSLPINIPDLGKSWKFVSVLSKQDKPLWDSGWETFDVEKQPPVPEYVLLSQTTHGVQSEWSTAWKIYAPQPLEWDDNPKVFHRKDKVLWLRSRCNDYLCSHLSSETLSQRKWGRSWRFMKLESTNMPQMSGTTSSRSDSSVIMPKIDKPKKHIYSEIDKSKPAEKRWADAPKLAKTQPRATKGPIKGAKGKQEAEKVSLEWVDSWKFSNDTLSSQMETISWSEWVNSWKFLLAPYPKTGTACKSI
ncbi:hypothetical protein ACEWY4_016529 [Coilia grayii]|uniref:Uncharacterized protein n=1 Tax=Coilia grayii TaxID=363190 RepID=A0ABD1JKM8_9TELE